MTASYNRKEGVAHVHHVQGTALALWRAAIREEARKQGATGLDPSVLPQTVRITFAMPRPKDHMMLRGGRYVVRQSYIWKQPASAPDLDKLVRAVLDALTGLAYHDDAQVVEIHARKVYGDTTIIDVREQDPTLPFGTQDGLRLGEAETASDHA